MEIVTGIMKSYLCFTASSAAYPDYKLELNDFKCEEQFITTQSGEANFWFATDFYISTDFLCLDVVV